MWNQIKKLQKRLLQLLSFSDYSPFFWVIVVKFNILGNERKEFVVTNGKSDALNSYLMNTEYEGAAYFEKILKTNEYNADAILLFTNGGSILSKIESEIYTPLFVVSSTSKADDKGLQSIASQMDISVTELTQNVFNDSMSQIFFWDSSKNNFFKQFVAGIFMVIAMTGLDQDMMQKNLTCKTENDAKKNMISMSVLLVIVNFAFLSLGALLFIYSEQFGVDIPIVDGRVRTDLLFPEIAMNQGLGKPLAVIFIIGLIAAAYSSADSALTSLTTSFSVDFLNIEKRLETEQKPLRKKVHIGVSLVLVIVVIIFNYLDGNVVSNLFKFATFTYGPLLGLFAFGILTKRNIKDKYAWIVALLSIGLSFGITLLPESVIGNYEFHWEILILNGFITFLGLLIISKKNPTKN